MTGERVKQGHRTAVPLVYEGAHGQPSAARGYDSGGAGDDSVVVDIDRKGLRIWELLAEILDLPAVLLVQKCMPIPREAQAPLSNQADGIPGVVDRPPARGGWRLVQDSRAGALGPNHRFGQVSAEASGASSSDTVCVHARAIAAGRRVDACRRRKLTNRIRQHLDPPRRRSESTRAQPFVPRNRTRQERS